MKTIRLDRHPLDAAAQERRFKGAALLPADAHTLLTEDADVYRADGEALLHFRKRVIPRAVCERAYRVLRTVEGDVSNRGVAAIGYGPQARRKDGTLSHQNRVEVWKYPHLAGVGSAIIGYMDRSAPARFPYCRQTAFNLEHPSMFAECMDYIRAVDAQFRLLAPARHAAQMDVIRRTHPDFVIHGTAFTTITVNKNFRTLAHQDVGDLAAGMGVMSVLEGGCYHGGFTLFPAFGVGADMRTGDVLVADVHQWHGNTPIEGRRDTFERIACVFYYRERMQECGSVAEELARVKLERDPLRQAVLV